MLGAAAGVGALMASVAGAEPAWAGAEDGDTVKVGGNYAADETTTISTSGGNGFAGITSAAEYSGLFGQDVSGGGGNGVAGVSKVGIGVSGKLNGLSGVTRPAAGVVGDFSNAGPGVVGLSSDGNGVYGVTTAGGQSGIAGSDQSPEGPNPGVGVSGQSVHGAGVSGYSQFGFGVYANATDPDSGIALYADGSSVLNGSVSATGQVDVTGPLLLSRSGVVTVSSGKSVKILQAGLSSASLVFATMQKLLNGIYVEAVVPNVSAGSFTIYLSKAVPAGEAATIGWFIVN